MIRRGLSLLLGLALALPGGAPARAQDGGGAGPSAVSTAPRVVLPPEVLAQVQGALTVRLRRHDGETLVTFEGHAPGGGEALLPLARGPLERLEARCGAAPACSVWVPFEPDPGDPDAPPWYAALVESPRSTNFRVDAVLAGEALGEGMGALLDLGPHRPLVVRAGPGLALAGVEAREESRGGLVALVEDAARLGVAWGETEEARAEATRRLESRLRPPPQLVVDGLYQVRMHSLVARLVVRERDPRPGPSLELRQVGEAEVLAVEQLPSGRPVPFRVRGETLVLEPGPGPGPRIYRVELAGPGPGEPTETLRLPTFTAPGWNQVPGLIALDAEHPGEDGSLVDAGAAVADPREALDSTLISAWGREGFLLYRATRRPASLQLAPRRLREDPLLPTLDVTTWLTGEPVELVDLQLGLPKGARWVDMAVLLPPGATAISLAEEGRRTAMVREGTASEGRPVVRVRVRDGATVALRYRRPVAVEDGALRMELPTFPAEIGKFSWAVHAAPGWLVGLPALAAAEGEEEPPGAAPAPPEEQGSAGASDLGLGGAAAEDTDPEEPPPETTGKIARFKRNALAAGSPVRLAVPWMPAGSRAASLGLLFLGGLLVGAWLLMRCPRDTGWLVLMPAGFLLAIFGVLGARVRAFPAPWMASFLQGVGFALLLGLLWWGLRPRGGARRDPRAPAPKPKAGGEGPASAPGASAKS